MVESSTKFSGICIAIYLTYALFVFFILPILLPDPLTMSRTILAQQINHLGNLTANTLEAGGQPKRSILVTFKGSGAISLLESLTHVPGCYHHFSPLIAYRRRLTKKPQIEQALDELKALLNCDYSRSQSMLNLGMNTPTFRNFYGMQWKTCLMYSPEVCSDPETLAKICRIFPFLNMSVYNLSLRNLRALLNQQDLNVRMLLLLRDPRAIMGLRANRPWCKTPGCLQPDDLCENMADDYEAAQILLKEYPQRFGIIRYEELMKNPNQGLASIFDFYGIPSKPVKEILKPNDGILDIKFKRNIDISLEPTFQWQHLLSAKEIMNIQATCKRAMSAWGYELIKDFKMKTLNNTID
ncbi:uncharacterized protein LOC6566469 [Drosophila grimshawi]|uniref:GH13652 n=1 Tax=Drosophila grimshawi TaxID=7222 RepID=B4JQ83_DROGR|nr:uncharacterized protein LOC6566469 [Drosophila grimshawi]XP_043070470.1 uncharacterized protein LOC6566469 [Drosophila grimshawi]EDV99063.1 GH13652 [Drosophila grimshawi]